MLRGVKRVGIIVVGLGLIAGLLFEGWAHVRMETRYQAAREAQRQLEAELAQARAERGRLFEVVAREQKRTEQLSRELAAKDQQLQEAVNRLTEEDLMVKDVEQRLLLVQGHSDRLQEELAMALNAQTSENASNTSKAVRLERVIVTGGGPAAVGRSGRVLSVHPEWRFVVIDLGWNNVEIGDIVSIYRQDQLLGKARIERVQEDVAAATLLPDWMQAEIQVNDVVRAL